MFRYHKHDAVCRLVSIFASILTKHSTPDLRVADPEHNQNEHDLQPPTTSTSAPRSASSAAAHGPSQSLGTMDGPQAPLISSTQRDDELQYDADEAPVIPDSWLKLFPQGVELSTSRALCPPDLPGEAAPTPESCQTAPGSS